MTEKITVLGAGAWGIAIARLLAKNGHLVRLWVHEQDHFRQLKTTGALAHLDLGDRLPESVILTTDISEALAQNKLLVLAVPAQFMRSVMTRVSSDDLRRGLVVSLAKGIETKTLKRMSEVVKEELRVRNSSVVVLSGPSHAEEVTRDMPTTVVAASTDSVSAEKVQRLFSSETFRVYCSDDVIGVELGGSLKNVIAIAAGIIHSLGLGDNTFGALLTRGLAELTRLGVAMKAKPETFAGLSGLGDLITTCVSPHSRNRTVGMRIGNGEPLSNILADMNQVAEGIPTTESAYQLSQKFDAEMPITREVYRILFEGKAPAEAISDLMGRSLKSEVWQ